MRRSPGEARLLGLWTAGCLAVLLLAGVLWVGDLGLQWPVFAVPLAWALVAVRPRRSTVAPRPPALPPPSSGVPPQRPAVPPSIRGDDAYPATREVPTLPPPPAPPGRRSGQW